MITKPKGTYDIFGIDAKLYQSIIDVIKDYMRVYNINYIRTPVFESTELFNRGVGETTDIVNKEMYTFLDKGNRSLTLRPEGTAGIVRSLIENKFYGNRNDVLKYYYIDTMYRYERPQAGRNREFTQFGIEFFNSNSNVVDAEVISIGFNLLKEFGLEDVVVNINSLGDKESLNNYKKALKEYLKPNLNKLCEDCQKRYDSNPLRIVDCKVDSDGEILKNIPTTLEYLSNESLERFNQIKNLLNVLEVNYKVNEKIVRGLDYYDEIVFEYLSDGGVVLGGGGRYNNLVSGLNGPNIPGVGFAFGLERVMDEVKKNINFERLKETVDVYILAVSTEEKFYALKIAQALRLNGIITELNINSDNLIKQFKYADDLNARQLVILKDDDLLKGIINIKDNITKEETTINEEEIVDYLLQNI